MKKMKAYSVLRALLAFSIGAGAYPSLAQDFVTSGKIEFEVKRNTQKLMGRQENSFEEYPAAETDVSYKDLLFAGNRLLYTPGKRPAQPSIFLSENIAFTDLDKNSRIVKLNYFNEGYVFEDSVRAVKWRLLPETRKIAGWECRKAVGVINDSIYVVAFYCPEIIPQGGPELFQGLPGMILGVAIPRMYTTWFATKVELASVDVSMVTPPTVKKGKQYKRGELAGVLFKIFVNNGWVPKDYTIEKMEQYMPNYILN